MYQEEHRTHCTNIESDNGLSIKDLISRPKGSQGAFSQPVKVYVSSMDIPPQTIIDPTPGGHTDWYYRKLNVLHSFSRPFHICHVCLMWTCFYLWKAQSASGGPANTGILGQICSSRLCLLVFTFSAPDLQVCWIFVYCQATALKLIL